MATKKQKKISKAWVAEAGGPKQYRVVIQPLGEWCVVKNPDTGWYSVTHLPTGLAGFRTPTLRSAEKVLGTWARAEHFTLATWTKDLAKRFQKLRDEALRS
jgi:hypothetical protein